MSIQKSTSSGDVFRFLLLGKTGCGKSTTGNTILGADLFDSDVSFESVTSECSLKRSQTPQGMIEIMDSPGLFDTGKSHEEVTALVMQAIACMHPGPDAIFYVLKIGRYTDEEYGCYTRLKALLDENVTKYLVVLFTHGDALKGKPMSEMMKNAPPKLREVLAECSERYVVIDNLHREEHPHQVDDVLAMVQRVKQQNGGQPYLCPKYATVGEKMEEEVNRRMQEVEKKELENKKHVLELTASLEHTQELANKEKEEFEQREKEREAQAQAQRQESDRKLQKLSEEMKKKNACQEEQKKRMNALKCELEAAEQRQRQEREQQRREEQERVEKLNKEKEAFMQELKRQKQEEAQRMAQEHAKQMQGLKDQVAKMKPKKVKKKCVIQ